MGQRHPSVFESWAQSEPFLPQREMPCGPSLAEQLAKEHAESFALAPMSPQDLANYGGDTVMSDLTNPKDRLGSAKVDLSLLPPVAVIHAAHAMMDGGAKYGPFNWREKKVRARVYIAAAQRHIASFLDGENCDGDDSTAGGSGVHHLGHAMACCAILLDAIETGNLIDDRPVKGAASRVLERLKAAS